MKIDLALIVEAILIIFAGLSLRVIGDSTLVIIPVGIGLIYILAACMNWPRIKIFLKYSFIAIVCILALAFDEYLTGPARHSDIVRTIWYTNSGVCTESTSCWIIGQFLPPIIALVSLIIGIVKLARFTKKTAQTARITS